MTRETPYGYNVRPSEQTQRTLRTMWINRFLRRHCNYGARVQGIFEGKSSQSSSVATRTLRRYPTVIEANFVGNWKFQLYSGFELRCMDTRWTAIRASGLVPTRTIVLVVHGCAEISVTNTSQVVPGESTRSPHRLAASLPPTEPRRATPATALLVAAVNPADITGAVLQRRYLWHRDVQGVAEGGRVGHG